MSGINVPRFSISPLERHQFPLSGTIGGVDVLLKCSALRYPVSQTGFTIVVTHGISGHKEQYHTTITRLLSLRDRATYDIREIWSIDFPNHGDAAILNRDVLDEHKTDGERHGYDGFCTTGDLGAYLNAFLSLPRFRGHNVIGMSHSGGCTAWVHALTKFARTPYLNALIFIEPTLMFPSMSPTDPRSVRGAANVRAARAKRDVWSSRKELRQFLTQRAKSSWSRWDPRVLELLLEHGYEEMTSSEKGTYVTPKLRKDEEAQLYACSEHTVEPEQLATLCKVLNQVGKRGIHFVWAEVEDFISPRAKADMLDAAEYRVTTIRAVKGSGHLVPHLKPDTLGETIHELLGMIGSGARSLL